jgi:hypothetical protein
MISSRSYSQEWSMGIRETAFGRDPILIEKMIMALALLENLCNSGLEFIFKGGTSLILLFKTPRRFSIDIDILLQDDRNLESYFQNVIQQGTFIRYEESRRAGELPKAHYKFFFRSVIQNKESQILLDILFEKNPYPALQQLPLETPLLSVEGEPVKVTCPAAECLLGDKLTAFAPHTTGIQYGLNKELEITKQLFDIGLLFDVVSNMELVSTTFEAIAAQELVYRALNELKILDVLQDAFDTACLIGLRGAGSPHEFAELQEGFKKLAAFIYAGTFTVDSAILCAAKTALLTTLLMKKERLIPRFETSASIAYWNITNPAYNKLNKLKKTSPEAFYYYFRALEMLRLNPGN